jgi:hypothetical protein
MYGVDRALTLGKRRRKRDQGLAAAVTLTSLEFPGYRRSNIKIASSNIKHRLLNTQSVVEAWTI